MAGRANRLIPFVIAGGIGIIGGRYIWEPEFTSGNVGQPDKPTEGRSQTVKDGADKDGSASSSPVAPLKYGGVSASDPHKQSVAGTSQESRKRGSVDHDVETHQGEKGGVGISEMRERKMKGQGLPSPQGGDTKAQVAKNSAETSQG